MQHLIEKTTPGKLPPIGKRSYGLKVVIDPDKCTSCGVCAMECPSKIIDMVPSGCEANRCLHCGTQKAFYRGKADPLYFNRACQNCHNCVSACENGAVSFQYFKNH